MTTRVGIVIRTRRRPEFLRRALVDVAAQTFDAWEIVVVNDGGDPDEVASVVAHSDVSDRVRVLHIAPGEGGRCTAANAGVRGVGGEFVVLHDDDDLWHPEFLAQTVAWLDAHGGALAVSAATEIVYEERHGGVWTEVGRAPFWAGMQRISLTEMMSVNRAVPISVLYRRSVHETVGWYDESLDAVEDWDFYLRMLRQGEFGFLSGEPLAFWTQRPDVVGLDANSMFDLSAEHRRDDALVRDRALQDWVAEQGAGLPLYLSRLQSELIDHINARFETSIERVRADVRADVRQELDAHQPLWSRLRRFRRRVRRR